MASTSPTQRANQETNEKSQIANTRTNSTGRNSETLKVDAAFSLQHQLHPSSHDPATATTPAPTTHPLITNALLVTSPYTEPQHLLDLRTLDKGSQLLAQALTTLATVRPDYAVAPYTESFNWGSVREALHELAAAENYTWTQRSFYVVVFRSLLRAEADLDRLHELDFRSHQEAVASGGLLKYWFGTKSEKRENLATCVWRNREDARLGGTGPWHEQARQAAPRLYERIEFTTLELVVGNEVDSWEFKEWGGRG